jgi:benzylsuccinate CoA-transferase BbsE subunit
MTIPAVAVYTGLKVVEIADDPAGEMVGRMLGEMGATVVKVEPPKGSPTRSVGPFDQHPGTAESSLSFRFYNTYKDSVVLDLDHAKGRRALAGLLADADLLITTYRAQELHALGVQPGPGGTHERLIVVAVTPFGLDGPWADYVSSDLVALAAAGPLMSCGYDDHTIPPIRPGGGQGYHTAASFAHLGCLLALIDRERTGFGQLVDVSMHESLAVTVELANPYWFYPRVLVQRQTCRHAQPVRTQPALFRTADDRYVYLTLITAEDQTWRKLVGWLATKDMAVDLQDPSYDSVEHRQANFSHIQDLVECFFLVQDAETIYRDGQQIGLPVGVLNAPEDLLTDRHLIAREFFVPIEDQSGRVALHPGPPYRFTAFEPAVPRPAPLLGEHNDTWVEAEAATVEARMVIK